MRLSINIISERILALALGFLLDALRTFNTLIVKWDDVSPEVSRDKKVGIFTTSNFVSPRSLLQPPTDRLKVSGACHG